MNTIIVIIALSLLIAFHELAHALLMKKYGIHIKSLSVGVGPKLWSRQSHYFNAPFEIRLLPIGGYVEPTSHGQRQWEKLEQRDWLKAIDICGAGVHSNLWLGLLLMFVARWWLNGADPVKMVGLSIITIYGLSLLHEKTRKCYSAFFIPLAGLCLMTLLMYAFVRLPITETVGGPISIVRFANSSETFADIIYKMGLISISIAATNVLPFGILDGGRIVKILFDRIGFPRVGSVVFGIGTLVLMFLFVVAIVNDLMGFYKK